MAQDSDNVPDTTPSEYPDEEDNESTPTSTKLTHKPTALKTFMPDNQNATNTTVDSNLTTVPNHGVNQTVLVSSTIVTSVTSGTNLVSSGTPIANVSVSHQKSGVSVITPPSLVMSLVSSFLLASFALIV